MAAKESNDGEMTRERLVEAARALAPMLRDEAEGAEKARRIPDHVHAALIDRGFFRILLPVASGAFQNSADVEEGSPA